MNSMKTSVCRAGGIILDKDRKHVVLVLNRLSHAKNENKWGLPKGHLHDEEMDEPHLGARREILEETGIFYPINKYDASVVLYDTRYYIIQLDKEKNWFFEPKDTTEIHEVRWMNFDKIKELNMNRGLSLLLHKYITN